MLYNLKGRASFNFRCNGCGCHSVKSCLCACNPCLQSSAEVSHRRLAPSLYESDPHRLWSQMLTENHEPHQNTKEARERLLWERERERERKQGAGERLRVCASSYSFTIKITRLARACNVVARVIILTPGYFLWSHTAARSFWIVLVLLQMSSFRE